MSQQDILPTDAGDTSLTKIEANFTELYTAKDNLEVVVNNASASAPASLDLHEDTDNGTNKITITAPSAVASDKVLTLPDATDTLVGKNTTDTLTNKTLTSPVINSPTGITQGDLTNLYKFSVYRNAAQNVGNGAYGKITFDTELYDSNNNFATGTYTVPVNGFYHFDSIVTYQAMGTTAMALYKNGAIFRKGFDAYNAGNTTYCGHVHCDLQLSAGDTIEIYVYGDGRAVTVGEIYNNFSGFLLYKA